MSADPAVIGPAPEHRASHAPFTCPNCAAENRGEFCSRCGQKRLHDGDLSLRHAWHHLLHETLHVDGRLLSTLKLLFTRPGQLTLDFVEGRRARHVNPVRLFVLFSAIFVLASSSNITIKQMLRSGESATGAGQGVRAEINREPAAPGVPRVKMTDRTAKIESRLRKKAEARGMPYALYVEHLDRRFAMALKIGYTLAISADGLWFALLFRRRFSYLAEHMVFALYLSCFGMIVNTLGGRLNHWVLGDAWQVGLALFVVNYVYYLLAARRVYGEGWLVLTLKGVVPFVMANLITFGVITIVFIHAVL